MTQEELRQEWNKQRNFLDENIRKRMEFLALSFATEKMILEDMDKAYERMTA